MYKSKAGNNLILIAIFILLAYLPVSSFLFAVKNDFFTGYFPAKFFLSESLQEGIIPLWNPYINYGIPAYGDMSSGYWNPLGWLIASTVGYNAYTFTIELLIYLIAAAAGMYKLAVHFGISRRVSAVAAISYACCGYFTGNLQHFNWITGAALLPWCLTAYLQYLESGNARGLARVLLCFFLFLTAAHPGLMIGSFYFFLFISAAWYFQTSSAKELHSAKSIFFRIIIFLVCLTLLTGCMFFAYADTIPFLTRADKPAGNGLTNGSTTLQSLVSLLTPLATVKEHAFFATDISMRNVYPGLFTLTAILSGLFAFKTVWQKWLLFISVFFIILSAGNIAGFSLKAILPLAGYVRLEGEFRIFALLALIIFGAMALNNLLKKGINAVFIKTTKALVYVLVPAIVLAIIHKVYTASGFFYSANDYNGLSVVNKIKFALNDLSVEDCIILQSLIQLIFLGLFYRMYKQINRKINFWIIGSELMIAVLLQLPFTGVGTKSVREIQGLISQAPEGIPIPAMEPAIKLISAYPQTDSTIGNWSMYSKQIAVQQQVLYPIVLKTTDSLFQSPEYPGSLDKPFAFMMPDSGQLVPTDFLPGKIILTADNPQNTDIVVKQNVYKYWKGETDGHEILLKQKAGFIACSIPAGRHTVTFTFDPEPIKILVYVQGILFTGLLVFLIISGRKNRKDIRTGRQTTASHLS